MEGASKWVLFLKACLIFSSFINSFGNFNVAAAKIKEERIERKLANDDQSGFISIDCGLPKNSTYIEKTTSINYISDATFIDTGVSKSLSPESRVTHQQQLWHLRSFPEGKRNCYRINITSGTKYLIRASFLYENYDGQNDFPEFELHLGANLWDTVKLENASLSVTPEIIHVPSLHYISICLVNIDSGTPFISAIELRTLKDTTYQTQSGSLSSLLRLDLGSSSNRAYRYNYDVYDRFWSPAAYNVDWTNISTSFTSDSLSQNDYQPPEVVMSTAATPLDTTASFDFSWNPDNASSQYYVYMHFAELQKLPANESRAFNISLNGKYWYGPLVPKYLSTSTIFSQSALSGGQYQFSLYMTKNSTLPPIINAIEIYIVKDLLQSETEQGDVDAITNIKATYKVSRNWQGDPCAPVTYLWDGVNCSYDGYEPPRITSLDLSSSGLTGEIAPHISKLTMLQYLDLSNNSLSGPMPDFLSKLQSLKVLKLEKNNLTGSVALELIEKSKNGLLTLSVDENPYLCSSTSCKNKKNNIVIPIVASVGGFFILLFTATAIFWILKKKKSYVSSNPQGASLESKQRQYTYSDVLKITNNFRRILGKGGFGTVYHGYIDDTQVAVKMLSPSSVQGYQQFQAEVKLLMRVHHRNLTSLVGYCNEETHMGLIYEYMELGNLDEHLSGEDSGAKLLSWEDRLRIAMDAAQGLEYLHNGSKPPIVHRDVKCTNILLNESLQAKLADFGLSKIFPTDGGTHVSTIVAGTPGYLDPEYYISNRLTEKSDVFSFGVVLLEIITRQPVITRNHDEKTHISNWVNFMLSKGDIKNIVDSRLHGDFDNNSAWKAVETAMACVSPNSTNRPTMNEVVMELKESLASELSRKNLNRGCKTKDSIELVSINEVTPLAR
ncbi:protein kinase family protein [Quillaja saponaria]|uniref:non-specific serine/threonine protein kinase n=1 Tax=Quillaja saponaria TaxID=32244 RepID=A0AAD7LRQ3_QUISA|nr:protein kinase family protein [Quillaja saponaria]